MITFVRKNILSIFCFFVLINPLLDIITGMQVKANMAFTIGMSIRAVFMVLACIYIFFISQVKQKKYACVYLCSILVYIILFLVNSYLSNGLSTAVQNFKETIKVFYFCFSLTILYVMYYEYPHAHFKKIISITASIYVISIVIAYITGTSFLSYGRGAGYSGWFFAANEVGAILVMLCPFLLTCSISNLTKENYRSNIIKFIYSIASLAAIVFCSLFIGTKNAFLGITIFVFIYIGWHLIFGLKFSNKCYLTNTLIGFIVLISIISLYFISPFRMNIENISTFFYEKALLNQNNITETTSSTTFTNLTDNNEDNISTTTQTPNVNKDENNDDKKTDTANKTTNTSIKQSQNTNEILKTTERLSFYNTLNWILSNRLTMVKPVYKEFQNGNFVTKFLGLGYVTTTSQENNISISIEMDLLSILFRHGYFGFMVVFLPIAVYVVYIFTKSVKKWRSVLFSKNYCVFLYSVLIGMFVSFATGHVLVAPAVSIYLAVLMFELLKEIDRVND